jgi:hypothetical protein
LIFKIANSGGANLTGLTISKNGTDSAAFTITASPVSPVLAAGETPFTVRLDAATAGQKTAALQIASNDPDETPYDINFTARVLSFTADADADGLSDAAEYLWRSLGFDWQLSQPALVAGFLADANRAGLHTAAQVQTLHIGTPLIARNPTTGQVKLTIGVKKATNLSNFQPLPLTTGTTAMNGAGELEFSFTPTDNAAFFRLESR